MHHRPCSGPVRAQAYPTRSLYGSCHWISARDRCRGCAGATLNSARPGARRRSNRARFGRTDRSDAARLRRGRRADCRALCRSFGARCSEWDSAMKWLLLLIPMVFTPALALPEPRPTLIAMDPAGGTDAVISADGRFILTSSRRSGVTAIWMYTIADRTWSQITDGKGDDTEPSWSPDSSRAVFVSKRDGQTDLWIVDIATRALKRLTNDAVEEEYPAWSPDGRLIVFTGGPWKIRNFFVVDPDGGPPRAVLLQAANVGASSFAGRTPRLLCHPHSTHLRHP